MNIDYYVNIHNENLFHQYEELSDSKFKYIMSSKKPCKYNIIDAYTNNRYQYLNKYIEMYTTLYRLYFLLDNKCDYIFYTGYRNIFGNLSNIKYEQYDIVSPVYIKLRGDNIVYYNFLKIFKNTKILDYCIKQLDDNDMYKYFYYETKLYPQYFICSYDIFELIFINLLKYIKLISNYILNIDAKNENRIFLHTIEYLMSYTIYNIALKYSHCGDVDYRILKYEEFNSNTV